MLHLYTNKTGAAATAAKPQDFVNWGTRQIDVPSPIKTNNNLHHLKTRNSLIDLFNKYFEVVPVDTPERLLKAYRLRYEVYCKEALIPGFHPEDYPEGLEYDQYDERSVHSLLMHKPSGLIAGTVRIILPDQDKLDTKFPVEKVASDSFYSNIASLKSLSRSHLGEISRLIIAPEFRGWQGENWYLYSILNNFGYLFQHNYQRKTNILKTDFDYRKNSWWKKSPHTILGLFVAIVRMSIKHDLKYWYAGMTQGHARGLYRIFGINFMPISPLVDYYGPCRSYLGYIPDIMEGIYRTNPEIWNLLTNNGALITRSNHLNAL